MCLSTMKKSNSGMSALEEICRRDALENCPQKRSQKLAELCVLSDSLRLHYFQHQDDHQWNGESLDQWHTEAEILKLGPTAHMGALSAKNPPTPTSSDG